MRKKGRLTLLREALALETAGGMWEIPHIAALMGVSTRTVYDLPGLAYTKVRVRGHERQIRRYEPATVRAWIRAQSDVARFHEPLRKRA